MPKTGTGERRMREPLLQIRDLVMSFDAPHGPTEAVRKVSFDVAAGEIVGIVGESGSGKSVTCRAILGLLPQTASVAGSIRFENKELVGLDSDALRQLRGEQISMIFQNPSSHLDPLMKIGQQVSEPLIHHEGARPADARKAAVEGLREVRLDHAAQRVDNYPHQLSGGMKQRAMIAAAVACRPRLLLADEPTTALDVTVQAHILDLLKELNTSKNLSIVLVSHDLAVIAQICNRVVVMRNGEVVEQGKTRDIIDSPQHEYTQQLIDSQPGRLSERRSGTGSSLPTGADIKAGREMTHPLLQIDKLRVEFDLPVSGWGFLPGARKKRSLTAVNNVSIDLQQGESLGIVGESGSGKSTLARVIMGLVRPAGGDVRLRGHSILGASPNGQGNFRRTIQMAFQNPFDSLNPRFTVRETIAEPLRKHRLVSKDHIDERVKELMGLVELDPQLSRRKSGQLSGGQCQRVGIARALAMDPEILIADEITSALDVTIQAQIIALLNRLRHQVGLTVIFISHDLALVRTFCDRVAVFRAGRIVETGSVNQVLSEPRQAYTRDLITSAPEL
jgi:peptide/nickel transport system ATP-binding protein